MVDLIHLQSESVGHIVTNELETRIAEPLKEGEREARRDMQQSVRRVASSRVGSHSHSGVVCVCVCVNLI